MASRDKPLRCRIIIEIGDVEREFCFECAEEMLSKLVNEASSIAKTLFKLAVDEYGARDQD